MARHKWNHPGILSKTRICQKCGCEIETEIITLYGTSRKKKNRWFKNPYGEFLILLAWDTPMPPCEPRDRGE